MQKEHGRKLRRSNFGKAEIDGTAWLLDDPHQIGNIRGRRES
jgi:hypothetical protein